MDRLLDISTIREKGWIILECVSGSRAYGLSTPESDLDIKGVFILPKEIYYGLEYTPQVSNETNDVVFYELNRFLDLLSQNNPNILELLNTPDEFIISKHPFLDEIRTERILSKQCRNTFGRFALSQMKKAKGLKKKIVNPIDKERKSLLSFCYVNVANGAIPLIDFLEERGWQQNFCGLTKIPHMRDMYGLYFEEGYKFEGIIRTSDSNDVCLSSIPKGVDHKALMYFNKDGYSSYCKEYREYWEWVNKRNTERYKNTISSGQNYDAKNMMHTIRLLEMAIEIGKYSEVRVHRSNRESLLSIKGGKFSYEELLSKANKLQIEMEDVYEKSELREYPDKAYINELAFSLRERFYKR